MAGTLPGVANTQRIDAQGRPLVGGKLYLYNAGTITPASAFKDFNLTTGQEQPFPIVLDDFGQIPPFYLADGFYRARLTNASGGTVLFDELQLPAVGNSTGSGGGGGTTVDPAAVFQTGDPIWSRKAGSRAGWVRANGRTIGNASSGASERANGDCQALFEWYWNNFSDTLNPVVGGRGASSSADWAADKQITIEDMRGRNAVGVDDMGNTAAGRITDTSFATPTSAGSTGGSGQVTLVEDQLPALTKNLSLSVSATTTATKFSGNVIASEVSGTKNVPDNSSVSTGAVAVTASGTVSFGGGASINKMPPGALGTWYIKL